MKIIFYFLICIFFSFHASAKIQTETQILLFDSDSYELSADAKIILDGLSEKLNALFDATLSIEGHTDNQGNKAYNADLSAKRALAVENYLISKGVNESIFNIQFFGELKPEKANTNEINRWQNRRVVLTLTNFEFENLEELNGALKKESTNEFVIQSQKNTVLQGKKGTILHVEQNSFIDESGELYRGKVLLEVTEAISFEDFIAHNLGTVCDEKMLESGGMMQVTAKTENGQPLSLQPGKQITMAIPTQNRVSKMELFVSESGENWEQTNEKIKNPLDIEMPPYPILNGYYRYKIPVFERDQTTKPVHPERRSKPRIPETPDPLDFAAEIKWYDVFWRKSKEEKAHANYMQAMKKYQKKLEVYAHFQGLYEHTMLNYEGNILAYKDALKSWDENQKADSLAFTSSPEYLQLKDENQRLYESALEKHKVAVEEWKALRKTRIGEMADKLDEMGLSSADLMNSYVSAMSDLSWINIDRFYNLDAKNSRPIALKDHDDDEEKVFLVFNQINSMLPVYKNGSHFVREKLPKNEEVHYFAYKVVDGKTWVCYKRVGAKNEYDLTYKPCKFSELKAILASMQRNENAA